MNGRGEIIVPNRREAYLRHSSYYSIILRTARDLFLYSGSSIKEGLDLINNDWANIHKLATFGLKYTN